MLDIRTCVAPFFISDRANGCKRSIEREYRRDSRDLISNHRGYRPYLKATVRFFFGCCAIIYPESIEILLARVVIRTNSFIMFIRVVGQCFFGVIKFVRARDPA